MVHPTLTTRATPRNITSTIPSIAAPRRLRPHTTPFLKNLQFLLGPRIATFRNFLLLTILLQSLVILLLFHTILAKNNALANTALSDYYTWRHAASVVGYQSQSDDHYGRPPPDNDRTVQEAIDEANYDDMSPAITGLTEVRKYTTLFSKFIRCKPTPCNIDHWPYLGDKCFYRDDHVKDRAGHNSSIWKLVENDWYYTEENDFACPVSICRHQWKEELNFSKRIVLRALQEHYKNGGNDTVWNIESMYSGSKYMRVNHFWGLEYKLHGSFTLTSVANDGNKIQKNKTATITVRRGFTQKFCDVSVNSDVPPPEAPLYIVVPYTGRIEQLRLFYQNIKNLTDDGVALRVILATYGGPVHILGASELLRDMQLGITEGEITDGHIVQVVETGGDNYGKFSRSRALLDGSLYVPADGLMFYCDVDMIIRKHFFDNCRHNAHRNYQVYFPIVYSLYPYGYKVSREHGYWRKGAFGMVCGYKSDFKRTKSWERGQKLLKGWGYEDVLLRKEFNKHWQISVFHAMEPNLLHRWHPKYCQFNKHIAACLGTVFQNMGSQQFLASIVAGKGIDVRHIKYDPPPLTFASYKNDSAGDSQRFLEIPASESETDDRKLKVFEKVYNEAIRSGTGGLLSVFAKEAREIAIQANAQQANQAKQQSTNGPAMAEAPVAGSTASLATKQSAQKNTGE